VDDLVGAPRGRLGWSMRRERSVMVVEDNEAIRAAAFSRNSDRERM
jgi:hypothetical protein